METGVISIVPANDAKALLDFLKSKEKRKKGIKNRIEKTIVFCAEAVIRKWIYVKCLIIYIIMTYLTVNPLPKSLVMVKK